jgi:hypothetical protein
MDDKELRTLLDQLQNEIKNTQAVDETGSQLLRDLDQDIHKLIERSGDDPLEDHPANIPLLENSLDYFEVTHPELTLLISRLLDFLSNTGI